MDASITAGWDDFLVATAGAAGALAGLVFVALSINLSRIMESPGLPERAGETLIMLGGTLIEGLVALIPSHMVFIGQILLVVAAGTWILPMRLQVRTWRKRQYRAVRYAVWRFLLHQVAVLPAVIAGILWSLSRPNAMDWLALGVLLSFAVALVNAWVLLVEILR